MKVYVITLILLLCKHFSRIRANNEIKNVSQERSIISFCPYTNPETYILQIKSLKIIPNPPQRGSQFIVEGQGTLNEDVLVGSYVLLSVTYGIIPILNMRIDLCEQTRKVQFPCPISKGEYQATREFYIPSSIFPGRYIIKADAFLENNKRIACFIVDITFIPKFFLKQLYFNNNQN
ncbi:hypothetical protein PNEG_01984 [Pneumocystis murina B123]|uniref:Phosphatidylglycerol/phosphatidylinositol transfer protein n=1 Tax=Pneumocystis murina (strain B123) TaxID=1069680 RepID=M7NMB5_PNEMU|nr:hypothetical protein PNEG_01984 [Pneumocystis murina B123]EMR09803.1 hypothetical protein PNEG_01984 [Pneumocystis murina B123]